MNLGYSNEKCEYLNKSMFKYIEIQSDHINLIKIRYIQKGKINKFQEFVYEIVDNEIYLLGFNLM